MLLALGVRNGQAERFRVVYTNKRGYGSARCPTCVHRALHAELACAHMLFPELGTSLDDIHSLLLQDCSISFLRPGHCISLSCSVPGLQNGLYIFLNTSSRLREGSAPSLAVSAAVTLGNYTRKYKKSGVLKLRNRHAWSRVSLLISNVSFIIAALVTLVYPIPIEHPYYARYERWYAFRLSSIQHSTVAPPLYEPRFGCIATR
jgi:hypothetical protein